MWCFVNGKKAITESKLSPKHPINEDWLKFKICALSSKNSAFNHMFQMPPWLYGTSPRSKKLTERKTFLDNKAKSHYSGFIFFIKYVSMTVSLKMAPITLNTIMKSFQEIFNVFYSFGHHLILYLFSQPNVIQNTQLWVILKENSKAAELPVQTDFLVFF